MNAVNVIVSNALLILLRRTQYIIDTTITHNKIHIATVSSPKYTSFMPRKEPSSNTDDVEAFPDIPAFSLSSFGVYAANLSMVATVGFDASVGSVFIQGEFMFLCYCICKKLII